MAGQVSVDFQDQCVLFAQLVDELTAMVEPLSEDDARCVMVWFGVDSEGAWVLSGDVVDLMREECKQCSAREFDFVSPGSEGTDAESAAWKFVYDFSRWMGVKCPGIGQFLKAMDGGILDELDEVEASAGKEVAA